MTHTSEERTMKRRLCVLAMALFVLGIVGIRNPQPTFAATPIQDCPSTEGALNTDITNAGPDGALQFTCSRPTTILFGTAGGGSGAPLSITQSVTLDASSASAAVTLDGQSTTQLFKISSGATLDLRQLTLQHGHSSNLAGAIDNEGGALSITNSTLSNNLANSAGGAIFNNGGSVAINGSTFSGNSAPSSADNSGFGGAIENDGTLTISRSTFSDNYAGETGGGAIDNGPGFTVTITNSTLSGNSALGNGGAIANDAGTVRVGGSVISNNGWDNCAIGFPVTDLGYNLEDTTLDTCGFSSTNHDIVGQAPQLGPLANRGGPTQTKALLRGSPAIDFIPTSSGQCASADQRGYSRPDGQENSCDIGADESGSGVCPSSESDVQSLVNAGAAAQLSCSTPTTITFTSRIVVLKSVTLDASGSAAPITFDGAGKTTFFDVGGGASLTLNTLILQNAHAAAGNEGAITSGGTVSILNSTVTGTNSGPAIVSDAGACRAVGPIATISNSTLSNNGSTLDGYGAIFNGCNGTVTISSSTVYGNSSTFGGAVTNLQGTVTINNSTIAHNSVTDSIGGSAFLNNNGVIKVAAPSSPQTPGEVTALAH